MKYIINKIFGNFDVKVSAEVDIPADVSELVHEFVRKGLLYVLERTPSTEVEQKVFAPMLGWELNEKGTSYKRPAGWERSSESYSVTLGDKIANAYNTSPGKLKVGEEVFKVAYTTVSIVENESDGGTSRKMATEMEAKLDAGMEMALGIKDDDSTDVRIEKCHKFLATLRKKK